MNRVLDGGPDLHMRRGNFEGEKGAARTCPDIPVLKTSSRG